jgi:hypothetical protein
MKVAFSARAEADFHGIGFRELRAKCEAFADAPLAFVQRPELRNLRGCPHGNYLILFKVVSTWPAGAT